VSETTTTGPTTVTRGHAQPENTGAIEAELQGLYSVWQSIRGLDVPAQQRIAAWLSSALGL
jgi:hypothetical protein